jgi:hypothetical protein
VQTQCAHPAAVFAGIGESVPKFPIALFYLSRNLSEAGSGSVTGASHFSDCAGSLFVAQFIGSR